MLEAVTIDFEVWPVGLCQLDGAVGKEMRNGRKERNVSIGGKEVMLKSVAQAMSMHVMNIFMLPEESIKEIHRAFNCYWWGNGNKENPIRWASWEFMCTSKSRGARILKARAKMECRKQYERSLNCVQCSALIEDTMHALFLYNWPRDVRSNMNLIDLTYHVSEISIEDMVAMAKNKGQRTLELMLMVMWRIWCVRNSKAHGGEEVEPNDMKESARVILKDFYQANAHLEAIVTPNIPSQVRWSPPCNGVININADGGISSRNSAAGIGFVMRSHNGSVLVAGNRRVTYATSVIAIEANAIFWAIQVAIAKGFRLFWRQIQIFLLVLSYTTRSCYRLGVSSCIYIDYVALSLHVLGPLCGVRGIE
nr:reverse transcriptase [Tanacetum cinerariifolium]GFA53810.1 reverse transcriptase [Tanacetum cinerariifolium]